MAPISTSVLSYSCLAILTLQNSALILTMRLSRTVSGPRYHTSTAVMLAEVIKCCISLVAYLYCRPRQQEKTSIEDTETKSLWTKIKEQRSGSFLYLLVPSFLYAVQNNFQFIAVSNLEAATFQVLYQGKLLTTAVCAIIFLNKKLSMMQLYSIMILSVGVACASIPSGKQSQQSALKSSSIVQSHSLGVGAVCAACFLSGFAGVYTESILKKTQPSPAEANKNTESKNCLLWLRNFQLSLSGLAFAAFGCFIIDRQAIMADGFWYGYTSIVWATIFLQAIGGLIVALVITYADNILKGFATSISVIISTVASAVLWGFEITPLFLAGMVAVLVATYMYSLPPKPKVVVPEIQVSSEEVVEEKTSLLEGHDEEKAAGMSKKGHSRNYSDLK